MKDLADTYISDLEVNHPLQRAILGHFTYQNSASYTELLPGGMTGNAFNYHLRALTKAKLIVKTGESYHITAKGKLVIETMSLDATRYKIRPVSSVFLYLTNELGEVLMYTSKRQPVIGITDLPAIKQRLGLNYLDSLNRILTKQKISLLNTHPACSLLNIKYYESDQLVFHRSGPCFFMTVKKSELGDYETLNVKSHWQTADSVEILKLLKDRPPIVELDIHR